MGISHKLLTYKNAPGSLLIRVSTVRARDGVPRRNGLCSVPIFLFTKKNQSPAPSLLLFREKCRLLWLCLCKRGHNASAALPIFTSAPAARSIFFGRLSHVAASERACRIFFCKNTALIYRLSLLSLQSLRILQGSGYDGRYPNRLLFILFTLFMNDMKRMHMHSVKFKRVAG